MELSNEILKKNVGVVHSTGSLSLLERKIVNVLLLNAYDDLLKNRTHSLRVSYLTAMLGWNESNNIADLKDALKKITSTTIEFNLMKDGKEVWKVMSMLSFAEIDNGICSYRYDEYLAERLFNPEIYAIINLGVQRQFRGSYALALYENCLRYKSVGSTGWIEVFVFRKLMGADSVLYDEFKYLKLKVINKSIQEINLVSDIWVEAKFAKSGRKITSVKFLIKDNPQKSLLSLEIADDYSIIRECEAYKKLKDHGIGDRLALNWLNNDKERTEKIIEYVEAQDRKKKVRGSTAGFIRKLVEEKAQVGSETPYELKKGEKQNSELLACIKEKFDEKRRELETEYKKTLVNEHFKRIDSKELELYISKYKILFGENKIDSYDPKSRKIIDSIQRVGFKAWLRSEIAKEITFSKDNFEKWILSKEQKHRIELQ